MVIYLNASNANLKIVFERNGFHFEGTHSYLNTKYDIWSTKSERIEIRSDWKNKIFKGAQTVIFQTVDNQNLPSKMVKIGKMTTFMSEKSEQKTIVMQVK